jgi:diaminohydroxyphosphoribosylaminopyrimidine deaminase / 5-amino-6-(5-phosphoribosylamino)uracil reductase
MLNHQSYMQRCLELAQKGAGYVAPNPLVGAVLVYDGRIIGEGYHERFGEAHAEVNCLKSVCTENKHLVEKSTLYVSLEPCSYFGKTPPCVDLIIENKIKHVVIGCKDNFELVNGKGIERLLAASVLVECGILEKECKAINKRFFTYHKKKRPYIILKWAQTNDGFIADENSKPIQITNEYTNKLVHKWRAEEAAILVGTKTVLQDNPSLTNRKWVGKNPVRIIIDINLSLPKSAFVFNDDAHTIIINNIREGLQGNVFYYKLKNENTVVQEILNCLFEQRLNVVIIEGGTKTLQHFINEDLWDEASVITNTALNIEHGISAPSLKNATMLNTKNIFSDRIDFYKHNNNEFL